MSHARERKEKNCLNCNAVVAGRFCQVCGQENIETHQTFGHLAGHFVSDIFHFDGQFLSTANYLLLKPGFLTHEYARGRRASYLDPIKMYFFVSAVFFLFFLGFFQDNGPIRFQEQKDLSAAELIVKLREDTAGMHKMISQYQGVSAVKNGLIKKLAEQDAAIAELKKDTTRKQEIYNRLVGPSFFGENKYNSREAYDSLQKALPEAQRDGIFKRTMAYRNIEVAKKFRENRHEAADELKESVLHHIPQTLFISLPLFALLLQLLYTRHKNLFYANHAIYTLHLYCALFVFMFINMLLNKTENMAYMSWVKWINYGVIAYATFYTFRALQVYYGQSFGKTLVKWLILNAVAFVAMVFLLGLEVMFAVYTI